MLTVVDKANGFVIQMVTNPKKEGALLRYQYAPEGGLGDTEQVKVADTLDEARTAIGHKVVATVELSKPKMDNPQNQPGYKADPGTGKREQLTKGRAKKK